MSSRSEEKKVHLPYFGIPKLWPYLRPYRFIFVSMILLGALGSVGDVILPLFQEYALDNFVAKNTMQGVAGFVLAYVGVLFLQVVVNAISAYQACQIESPGVSMMLIRCSKAPAFGFAWSCNVQ